MQQAEKYNDEQQREAMRIMAREQQQAWQCPRAGCDSHTTEANCLSVIDDVVALTDEPCLKDMYTCPKYYQSLPGIQGPRGVIAAYNFTNNGNRAALPIFYPNSIPAIVMDAFVVMDSTIARKDAADQARRDHELDELRNKK